MSVDYFPRVAFIELRFINCFLNDLNPYSRPPHGFRLWPFDLGVEETNSWLFPSAALRAGLLNTSSAAFGFSRGGHSRSKSRAGTALPSHSYCLPGFLAAEF